MKITMESTIEITQLDGVPVRVWEGLTEQGIACKVFVHRLAVRDDEDCEQFEKELCEMSKPGEAEVRTVDLRQVLS